MRIDTIEVAHALSEVALYGFDNNVIVVVHQTPRMADPVESLAGLGKYFQPDEAIRIVKKNILAPVAARGHVINPAS
ncbi:hypothetical protein TK5_20940 [Sideroxyarcus sp. TK5]